MDYYINTLREVSNAADEEPEEEKPLVTDYYTTRLYVKEAGSYWLNGYDPVNGVAGTAYPNAITLDATEAAGDVVLVGNAKNNVIRAGEGNSSLWGGLDGDDTLEGGSGRDMFWYGRGDDNDVVMDFTAGAEETSDVLNLYHGKLASITRTAKTVTVKMSDGGSVAVKTSAGVDEVLLHSSDAKTIQQAKIGYTSMENNMTYAEAVTYYKGGDARDVLTLADGIEEKVVWLDSGREKKYVSIDVVDGSQSSGADQLAGSARAESIVGGRGDASLWGGGGSASDTLRAGTGKNVLYYGYGEGNDYMQNTYRNDKVMLYNISRSQLTKAEISGETVRVTTTAGHTLTVGGRATVFTLADGTSWEPDRQKGIWKAI